MTISFILLIGQIIQILLFFTIQYEENGERKNKHYVLYRNSPHEDFWFRQPQDDLDIPQIIENIKSWQRNHKTLRIPYADLTIELNNLKERLNEA